MLCTDLLKGLLERDPLCRISFESFFHHQFIDLDHMPSAQSLEKAVSYFIIYKPWPRGVYVPACEEFVCDISREPEARGIYHK